jgi:ubiquinone/menaquinone biosynthesis C-methylase UbiE
MSLGRRKVSLADPSAWIFNRMAPVYGARPAYPEALVTALADVTGWSGRRVLDIGAGIGHLSLPLSQRGLDVVALEPASAMLERLQAAALERDLAIRAVHGTAESMPLESSSVDLAVLADVVHFLDKELASLEVSRVLARPGALAIVTSEFGDTPYMRSVREIMNDAAPRRPREVMPAIEQFAAVARAPLTVVRRFEDETPVDARTLEDILGSISFIGPAMNAERARAFRERIHGLPYEPLWARTFTLYVGYRGRRGARG